MAHKSMGSEDATPLARNLPGPQNTESTPAKTGPTPATTAPQAPGASPTPPTPSITPAAPTPPAAPTAEDSPAPPAPVTCTELTGLLARITATTLPVTPSALVGLLKVLTLLINALTCLQARVQAGLLEARRQEAKTAGRALRPVRGAGTPEIGVTCRLSPE